MPRTFTPVFLLLCLLSSSLWARTRVPLLPPTDSACQAITAELVNPPAREDRFIDLCVGEPLTLTGRGVYPENGTTYTQSDETSTFTWIFQDGTERSGREVTYSYDRPGGYIAQLIITDERGCQNANRISQRVRVAPPPNFDIPAGLPSLCIGDTLTLGTAPDASTDVVADVAPQSFRFQTTRSFSEPLDVPDGAGQVYGANITFTDFEPSRRVMTAEDVQRVCIDLEHSYAGDLDVWIECPDGNRVNLLRYDPFGRGAADEQFGNPQNGEGLTYCWTNTATQTVDEVARSLPPHSNDEPPTIPADVDYLPLDDGFDNFVGCRLNGAWSLNVRDNLLSDDGTIFSWSITFADVNDSLARETSIPLTMLEWPEVPSLTIQNPGLVTAFVPAFPGFANLPLRATDSLGCTFDTLVTIDVASPYAEACYECPELPEEMDSLQVCGSAEIQYAPRTVNTLGDTVETVWRAYVDPLAASSIREDQTTLTITDHTPNLLNGTGAILSAIGLNFPNGLSTYAKISLMGPDGTRVQLLDGRPGTTGNPIYNLTFTPDRDPALFASLADVPVNGEWTLSLSSSTTEFVLPLSNWALHLRRAPETEYRWSGRTEDLSCTDCPNPVIRPTASGTYTLTATNTDGCTARESIYVNLEEFAVAFDSTITADCEAGGRIVLTPLMDDSDLSYSWSDGGRGLVRDSLPAGTYDLTASDINGCQAVRSFRVPEGIPPSFTVERQGITCAGATDGKLALSELRAAGATATFSWGNPEIFSTDSVIVGLDTGTYVLRIRTGDGCALDSVFRFVAPAPIRLDGMVNPITCPGEQDASILIDVTGGRPDYTYAWAADTLTGGRLDSLPPGEYAVTVMDAWGCAADTTFIVNDPDPITFDVAITGPTCPNVADGRIEIAATGGSGRLRYSIGDGAFSGGSVRAGLGVGTYLVTVMDAAGCRVSDSVYVATVNNFGVDLGEPLEITFGDSIILRPEITGGEGDIDVRWTASYDSTLSCTDCLQPTARPPYEIDYTLSLMDELGCMAEDRLRVRVRIVREVAVPTAFSPDGNGRNERLIVHGRPGTRVLRFAVYDPWGGLLYRADDFEVNDATAGWDGKGPDGTPLNAGGYVYRLLVRYEDGGTEELSGQTTLIR